MHHRHYTHPPGTNPPHEARRGQREAARRRERRRWIALGVLCLGQLMMVLDATIVNVALPAIQRDLHFTQATSPG